MCLDHVFIFNEPHLEKVLAEYVAISSTGARFGRWDNGRLVRRHHARFIEATKLERSSRFLCWEAFITFIGKPHDGDVAYSCALQHRSDHEQLDRGIAQCSFLFVPPQFHPLLGRVRGARVLDI